MTTLLSRLYKPIALLAACCLLFISSACTRETQDVALPAVIQENTIANQDVARAAISEAYATTEEATEDGFTRNTGGKLTEEDLPEDAKVMYLTFDDGPSSNTTRILDILDEYDCEATFFVVYPYGYAKYYNEIVERGHTIALHSYTHDYANIYSSEEAYFADLQKISDAVYDATGVRSNLIRFPGGSSNTVSEDYNLGIMTRLTKEVEARGYHYFDWDSTNADASPIDYTPDELFANATYYYDDSMIMLMHDNDYHGATVEALPKIIEFYKDMGYYFLSLNENSPGEHLYVNN